MNRFRIEKMIVNTKTGKEEIIPKKINIFIGPNNSGKSRILKELRDYLNGDNDDLKIISVLEHEFPASLEELDTAYDLCKKVTKNLYGDWSLKGFANKPPRSWDINNSIESLYTSNMTVMGRDWKKYLTDVISGKRYADYFRIMGPLFCQYIGTEERLTICKTQKSYGLDSHSTNYLSFCRNKVKVLNELSRKVQKLFFKDIYLDYQTLGDRLTFRVGQDFSYMRTGNSIDEDAITQLYEESMLDDQGDGIKSFVSTFLALQLENVDLLLLDEPEAFLHPPLARQLGEMIGETQGDNKQIYISTHSVEILKGILSKCQDVNVIRITQPEDKKNEIKKIDKTILNNILETPLLRVSRVMEGLFCQKVIITESEADELIYQELIEKAFPQSGVYFAHSQNKQTLVEIAKLYKEIGLEYEIITDFDVLRVASEYSKFLALMDLEEKKKQRYISYSEKLREIVNGSVCTDGMTEEDAKKALKAKRDEVYHKQGISFFEEEIQKKVISTLEEMSAGHLHILETGELETLLIDYDVLYKEKKLWISEAINKVAELSKEEIERNKRLHVFLMRIVGKQ